MLHTFKYVNTVFTKDFSTGNQEKKEVEGEKKQLKKSLTPNFNSSIFKTFLKKCSITGKNLEWDHIHRTVHLTILQLTEDSAIN